MPDLTEAERQMVELFEGLGNKHGLVDVDIPPRIKDFLAPVSLASEQMATLRRVAKFALIEDEQNDSRAGGPNLPAFPVEVGLINLVAQTLSWYYFVYMDSRNGLKSMRSTARHLTQKFRTIEGLHDLVRLIALSSANDDVESVSGLAATIAVLYILTQAQDFSREFLFRDFFKLVEEIGEQLSDRLITLNRVLALKESDLILLLNFVANLVNSMLPIAPVVIVWLLTFASLVTPLADSEAEWLTSSEQATDVLSELLRDPDFDPDGELIEYRDYCIKILGEHRPEGHSAEGLEGLKIIARVTGSALLTYVRKRVPALFPPSTTRNYSTSSSDIGLTTMADRVLLTLIDRLSLQKISLTLQIRLGSQSLVPYFMTGTRLDESGPIRTHSLRVDLEWYDDQFLKEEIDLWNKAQSRASTEQFIPRNFKPVRVDFFISEEPHKHSTPSAAVFAILATIHKFDGIVRKEGFSVDLSFEDNCLIETLDGKEAKQVTTGITSSLDRTAPMRISKRGSCGNCQLLVGFPRPEASQVSAGSEYRYSPELFQALILPRSFSISSQQVDYENDLYFWFQGWFNPRTIMSQSYAYMPRALGLVHKASIPELAAISALPGSVLPAFLDDDDLYACLLNIASDIDLIVLDPDGWKTQKEVENFERIVALDLRSVLIFTTSPELYLGWKEQAMDRNTLFRVLRTPKSTFQDPNELFRWILTGTITEVRQANSLSYSALSGWAAETFNLSHSWESVRARMGNLSPEFNSMNMAPLDDFPLLTTSIANSGILPFPLFSRKTIRPIVATDWDPHGGQKGPESPWVDVVSRAHYVASLRYVTLLQWAFHIGGNTRLKDIRTIVGLAEPLGKEYRAYSMSSSIGIEASLPRPQATIFLSEQGADGYWESSWPPKDMVRRIVDRSLTSDKFASHLILVETAPAREGMPDEDIVRTIINAKIAQVEMNKEGPVVLCYPSLTTPEKEQIEGLIIQALTQLGDENERPLRRLLGSRETLTDVRNRFYATIPTPIREEIAQLAPNRCIAIVNSPQWPIECLEERIDGPVIRIQARDTLQLLHMLYVLSFNEVIRKKTDPSILVIAPAYDKKDLYKEGDSAATLAHAIAVTEGQERAKELLVDFADSADLKNRMKMKVVTSCDAMSRRADVLALLGQGWDVIVVLGEGTFLKNTEEDTIQTSVLLGPRTMLTGSPLNSPGVVCVPFSEVSLTNSVLILVSCYNSLNAGDYTDLASAAISSGARAVIGTTLPIGIRSAFEFLRGFTERYLVEGRKLWWSYWQAKKNLSFPSRESLICIGDGDAQLLR
jgi:hypothetical protein